MNILEMNKFIWLSWLFCWNKKIMCCRKLVWLQISRSWFGGAVQEHNLIMKYKDGNILICLQFLILMLSFNWTWCYVCVAPLMLQRFQCALQKKDPPKPLYINPVLSRNSLIGLDGYIMHKMHVLFQDYFLSPFLSLKLEIKLPYQAMLQQPAEVKYCLYCMTCWNKQLHEKVNYWTVMFL